MKKLLLIFISPILFFTNQGFAQWVAQVAPTGTGNLYCVYAIDSLAVATAGEETTPRTIDGGSTWTSNVTISGVDFYSIHTGEPTHWYSLSLNNTWYVELGNPSGVSLTNGKPTDITSLHFYSAGCAVAVGTTGAVQTTCDTGNTWTAQVSGTTENLNSVWFAGGTIACAVGVLGTIIRTTDGGATWHNIITSTTATLKGVTFPTASVGYICGNTGAFLKSTDTGSSWVSMPTGVTNNLNGVYFINADTGYVVGTGGLIMNTMNGGTSWTTMLSGTSYILHSVNFATPTAGWAVGDSATILKFEPTLTGGASLTTDGIITVYPNPSDGNFTLEMNDEKFKMANGNCMLVISDVTGREVLSFSLQQSKSNVNASGLANGIYYSKVIAGDKVTGIGKIVIAK